MLLSANKFFSQCLLSVCVYSMYNYCVIVPIFIVPLVISNDKIQWMCGDGTTCCLWNCCNHIHLSVLTSPGEMTINQSIVWLPICGQFRSLVCSISMWTWLFRVGELFYIFLLVFGFFISLKYSHVNPEL